MEHQVDRKTQVEGYLSFIKCSAPLCPLDEDLDTQMWYPDEPICAKEGISLEHPWLQTQKKIAKRTRRQGLYYTGKMVQRNCVVGVGMVGLDPDRDEKPQLERWLRIHPAKRELTEEEKAILRERLEKIRIRPLGVKS